MAELSELIGRILDGKYQLDRLLGQGGMGAVYLATHLGTKRPVALKVIAPQFMTNAEFVERFKREAEAAGRLRHPNVVNVTDFGFARVGSDQLAYLVMEYLDGSTLAETLKQRGQLPLGFVVDLVEQICLAIDHAHQQGIIHRDLKPDNIWLEPDRRGGYNVKVLDFGLAKLRDTALAVTNQETATASRVVTPAADTADGAATAARTTIAAGGPHTGTGAAEDAAEAPTQILLAPAAEEEKTLIFGQSPIPAADAATSLGGEGKTGLFQLQPTVAAQDLKTAHAAGVTRVGAVLGTPHYMSPEQCRGETLDARADIYSIGVITYQMLAGELPFTGDTYQLILKHCEEPPPLLRERRADLPKSVATVVMSALAKPRAERPASAGAFANALRSTAEGEVQLLRQAKYHYSQMMPTFIGVSLVTRAPFILLSALLSLMLESLTSVPPAWGFISFWLVVLWLILSSNGLHTAACTLVIKQLRLAPLSVVPLRPVLKATLKCLPELLLTMLRSQWSILLGLVKFIAPGLKRCVDHALYPAVVVMEGEKGAAALDRSRTLVARLRVMALAFEARDFGISLGSVLLFSFFVIIGMIWSGAPRESMFGVLRTLHLPALAYCWFFVVATHPSFAGVPLALLYFRARQAGGETIEEAFTENFEAQTSRTRPNKLNKGTLGWLLVPLLMLAAMIAGPLWGGEQSLIGAVQRGRHSTVQRLLASGATAESRGAGGMTALMIAAREGHLDIARLLMAAGAQIEARSDQGHTPLMSAALAGQAEMVKALLAAGAEVNAKDPDGDTALMMAARRGRLEVIKVLLSAGANGSAADKNGKTALMYAEEEGYPEAARLLREAGGRQ